MPLRRLLLSDLEVPGERPFRNLALYRALRQRLVADAYPFRVGDPDLPWPRALFLNLTFWADEGDVLTEASIEPDVVAHTGWHHAIKAALPGNRSADALFFGESVASAFDLYLVGRLLPLAPDCDFLATQLPAMADAAAELGMDEAEFEALIEAVTADPDRAFEDLRALLFDLTTALVSAPNPDAADAVLRRFDDHRFAALLHHYELSTWLLYARAHAGTLDADPEVRALHAAVAAATSPLDHLAAACGLTDA